MTSETCHCGFKLATNPEWTRGKEMGAGHHERCTNGLLLLEADEADEADGTVCNALVCDVIIPFDHKWCEEHAAHWGQDVLGNVLPTADPRACLPEAPKPLCVYCGSPLGVHQGCPARDDETGPGPCEAGELGHCAAKAVVTTPVCCSFCHRGKDEVGALVTAVDGDAAICGECVVEASGQVLGLATSLLARAQSAVKQQRAAQGEKNREALETRDTLQEPPK